MKRCISYMFILCALFLLSCRRDMQEKAKSMQGEYTRISTEKMLSGLDSFPEWQNIHKKFMYVSYIDSSLCSSCNIKQLQLWNDLIKKMGYEKYNSIAFMYSVVFM